MKSLILVLLSGMIMSSFSIEKSIPASKTINPLHAVSVSDAAGLLMDGTIDVTQFISSNGRLWAVCKLKGKIGGLPVNLDCVVPIRVTDCDGGIRLSSAGQQTKPILGEKPHDCECITIIFEPCTVPPEVGPALTLNQEEVPCGLQDFSGDVLCCVNRLVGTSGSSIHEICACMNRLL
jgi:hypothetical protein